MERVYPIRCTISGDSPHLPGDQQRSDVPQQRTILVESQFPKRQTSAPIQSDATATDAESVRTRSPEPPGWPVSVAGAIVPETSQLNMPQLVYTERCEYAFNDKDGHGTVSGTRKQITRCEDEPIHTPGAVQSHGMLIGLEVLEGHGLPRYICRVVSENCQAVCKYSPRFLLQLDDFLRIFPVHQRLIFESHARSVIANYKKMLKPAEPKVFSTSFMDPSGYIVPSWGAMHFLGGNHNLLVCEFELEVSLGINQALLNGLPSTPYDSLKSDPIDAAASFVSRGEPLDITGDTVDAFQGEGSAMELVRVMSQIQLQLSRSVDTQELLDAIVAITKQLTGFHRSMVYQFDEDYNGTVVAELVDPQVCTDVYRGLHFPASDIPKQARELYKLNRVRVLFDRDSKPSRLICRNIEDLKTPLDLTHSYLRAMSPVHLKYLGNMGVKSTMSTALNYQNQLWGLICCHSYGPSGLRVPFPVRELCYWVGLCASNCLDKLLNAQKLRDRNSLISMQIGVSPHLCISASSGDLLRLFQADFGFLVVKGEARTIGKLSSYPEAVTLLRYVYFRSFSTTYATKNVSQDFADLVYKPGFEHIAGLFVIPLSRDAGDFIVFFKKNQITEVHWAGNPNMAKIEPLEPRDSFKAWIETVKDTCRPWGNEQFEAAAMTRLVYGNFIRVWREKEAALHESRLKRLLLLNLSHEVRTPLNAVVNYLEIALEKSLDDETKDILTESHEASKSLIYVIDNLLHLTDGGYQTPISRSHVSFNLRESVQTTLDQLQRHATLKALYLNIEQDDKLPHRICGDLRGFEQAIAQIVTNAIQHTRQGGIRIFLGARPNTDESYLIDIAVHDTGVGMSEAALDELFQEFEQVPDEDVSTDEKNLHGTTESPDDVKKEARLGLGLALVARYIKQCGGQIRGRSTAGEGSTFTLEIPMQLEKDNSISLRPSAVTPSGSSDMGDKGPTVSLARLSESTAIVKEPRTPARQHVERPPISAAFVQSSVPLSNTVSPRDIIESTQAAPRPEKLSVLVADDNSVNLSIFKRRLEKLGHEVKTSLDGQECFDAFQEHRDAMHFILMDINMPLVNGIQATRMIRQLESSAAPISPIQPESSEIRQAHIEIASISPPPTNSSSSVHSGHAIMSDYFTLPASPPKSDPTSRQSSFAPRTASPGVLRSAQKSMTQPHIPDRMPIFAVSASLDQHTQESLATAGFDGWLSKPVDFKRLCVVLEGVLSREARLQAKSAAGDFAGGGWFD